MTFRSVIPVIRNILIALSVTAAIGLLLSAVTAPAEADVAQRVALSDGAADSAQTRAAAFTQPLSIPPVLSSAHITLTAQLSNVQILAGAKTAMWTYNGAFPGPTIRRPTGTTTTVTLINSLPITAGDLTLHLHGGHQAAVDDGSPYANLVAPGAQRTYTFPHMEAGAPERGSTEWYHDHLMDETGRNVWMGLAGMYILDDPADPSSLPNGNFDVPLIIVDRNFSAGNQLNYAFNANGVFGSQLLVNGVPQPYMDVAARKYRFRVLNASNMRDYDLKMSTPLSLTQIGTESGLLPAPVTRTDIPLGPSERADIVIDFTGLFGQNLVLQNAGGAGNLLDVLQFRVNSNAADSGPIPSSLRALPVQAAPVMTRTFVFGKVSTTWTINNLGFDMNRVDAQPLLGTTEKWILQNSSSVHHLVHIHGADQILLKRNGAAPAAYELLKETWHIEAGETVEILIRFSDYTGRFVFHCHMLEHEDGAMMSQYDVMMQKLFLPLVER